MMDSGQITETSNIPMMSEGVLFSTTRNNDRISDLFSRPTFRPGRFQYHSPDKLTIFSKAVIFRYR